MAAQKLVLRTRTGREKRFSPFCRLPRDGHRLPARGENPPAGQSGSERGDGPVLAGRGGGAFVLVFCLGFLPWLCLGFVLVFVLVVARPLDPCGSTSRQTPRTKCAAMNPQMCKRRRCSGQGSQRAKMYTPLPALLLLVHFAGSLPGSLQPKMSAEPDKTACNELGDAPTREPSAFSAFGISPVFRSYREK